ncbi:hypothetical protein E4U22_000326, partial [Claviceps purpurea]
LSHSHSSWFRHYSSKPSILPLSHSGSSSCRPPSSPPPTASKTGKGKASKPKGDEYDVYLAPHHINRSGVKDRLPNDKSLFTYQTDTYVRDKVISPTTYVGRRSAIWVYGEAVRKESEPPGSALMWYCYCCERDNNPQSFQLADGGGCRRHLMKSHGYNEHTKSFHVQGLLDQTNHADGADASTASANRPIHPKDRHILFKQKLIKFIIHCHAPFYMVENQYFRELIEFS